MATILAVWSSSAFKCTVAIFNTPTHHAISKTACTVYLKFGMYLPFTT